MTAALARLVGDPELRARMSEQSRAIDQATDGADVVAFADALRRAVSTEDLNALTMVPGIGKKGAQRIVLEMKDRLGPPGDDGAALPALAAPRVPSWRDQVQSGLVNLGWPARDADQAIAALEDEGVIGGPDGDAVDVATVLRAALRKLSRR